MGDNGGTMLFFVNEKYILIIETKSSFKKRGG